MSVFQLYRNKAFRILVFATYISLAITACSEVHVQTHDGVEITRHLGVVSVDVKASTGPSVTNISGLGVIGGYQGISAGWFDASVVAIPKDDGCRAVFVIESLEEFEKIRKVLKNSNVDLDEICLTKGRKL